ncbi:MAG: hypothetical protein AB8G96_11850 [Phycisphaerales bacterium]
MPGDAAGRAGDGAADRAAERAGDGAADRAAERAADRAGERAAERAGDRAAQRAGEQSGAAVPRGAVDVAGELAADVSVDVAAGEPAQRAMADGTSSSKPVKMTRHWRVPPGIVPPPPRPGDRHVRVHRLGVVLASDRLRRRVDRRFHLPMIVLAVMVLPLLAIEMLVFPKFPVLQQGILGLLVPIGFAVIWLAFLIEFVIKIMIAESRIEYVRRHWLDVVIIAVPVLRPLRVARIARTARVFTLRGVGMKFLRYGLAVFIGAEIGERMAARLGLRKNPRPEPGKMTRHQLETELTLQRRRVDAWDAWYAEHREHRDTYGTDVDFDARARPEVTVPELDAGPDPDDEDPRPGAASPPTPAGPAPASAEEMEAGQAGQAGLRRVPRSPGRGASGRGTPELGTPASGAPDP